MDRDLKIVVGGSVAVLCGILVLAYFVGKNDEEKCAAAGGRIISKVSTGVGPSFGTNGGVAVVTNTVTFCVTADGRILY